MTMLGKRTWESNVYAFASVEESAKETVHFDEDHLSNFPSCALLPKRIQALASTHDLNEPKESRGHRYPTPPIDWILSY
jgi:hypothetical protein